MDICATSFIDLEVRNDIEYELKRNLGSLLFDESWNDVDEDDNEHIECEICHKLETSSEVHSKIEHLCFDPSILDFSNLENELNDLCDVSRKYFSQNKSFGSYESNLEKEIIQEDKMSRLDSSIEIDLECEMYKDYKDDINKANEMANILSRFELSSKSLRNLLSSQKKFGDRADLDYDLDESSTRKSKHNKFVKPLIKD